MLQPIQNWMNGLPCGTKLLTRVAPMQRALIAIHISQHRNISQIYIIAPFNVWNAHRKPDMLKCMSHCCKEPNIYIYSVTYLHMTSKQITLVVVIDQWRQYILFPKYPSHMIHWNRVMCNPHSTMSGQSDPWRSFPCSAQKLSASQFWDFMTLWGYLLWFHFR